MIALCLASLSGCAIDATIRAKPSEFSGSYYSGDGLGRMVFVTLNPDGTFRGDWHGCLGPYGEATGHWRIEAEKILFAVDTEAGMLAGYLREATTIRHRGEFGFVRDEDAQGQPVYESLIFLRRSSVD